MNLVNKRALLVLAIAAANGLLAYALLPQPQPQFASAEETPALTLGDMPGNTPEQEEDFYQSLRARQLWGPEGAATPASQAEVEAPKPATRFAGVVYEGNIPYMLMLDPDSKLQRYAVGADLPDDSRLLEVRPDAVDLEKAEQRETVYLYRQN